MPSPSGSNTITSIRPCRVGPRKSGRRGGVLLLRRRYGPASTSWTSSSLTSWFSRARWARFQSSQRKVRLYCISLYYIVKVVSHCHRALNLHTYARSLRSFSKDRPHGISICTGNREGKGNIRLVSNFFTHGRRTTGQTDKSMLYSFQKGTRGILNIMPRV
jgi:hypothetical protein